ncbi:MAG: AarF/ABC1/UbiB kinase family protein [Sinobacterium sp.]|nr:AarF/ABC1/UbiB kinase family protein [Sinobacterium sp.]
MRQTSVAMNKLAIQMLKSKNRKADFPEKLQSSMQSLGATYIKLGQLIASSPTLFPIEYVEAFQVCLDQTEKLPFSTIEKILQEELGVKLKTKFRYIDPIPLASASIAQVHAAELMTGEQVVLKVQKPGVKELLETDFQFLQLSTQLMEMVNAKNWKSSLSDIVEEIRNGMVEECDFRQEVDNIEEFARFLDSENVEAVTVPTVYREVCSSKVITMERFYGVSLSDTAGIKAITNDPQSALLQALDTWFSSLRNCQLYHADLHAGNVMMLNDGRIGFIDFGIVGRLSDKTWEGLTSLTVCVPAQDFRGLAEALSKIGATKEALNLDKFAEDLEKLWVKVSNDDMLDQSDPDSFWRAITVDFSVISKRHGIRFPREFTLLLKQFLYFDRYIRVLAPEASMFDEARMGMLENHA